MSKVTTLEPVAHRWAAPIAGEGGGTVGRRQWEYSTTQKGLPWWDRDGLVTIGQAEAYAAAKVREALEEAADIANEWAMKYVEVDTAHVKVGFYILDEMKPTD